MSLNKYWGDRRLIPDVELTTARPDVAFMTISRLRASFEKCKHEQGWPESASPMWEIRWTYEEEA
jgi:hypothetical protein